MEIIFEYNSTATSAKSGDGLVFSVDFFNDDCDMVLLFEVDINER